MKTETVKIDTLDHDPENARKHSERNLNAIATSLAEFGQRKPIVVRGSTVLAGNGTLEAARLLGWEKITITRVPDDWTDAQARAYALADNRTSELGEWDFLVLAEQIEALGELGFDLVQDYDFAPPTPPTDAVEEWTNMPEYTSENLQSVFHTTVHFPSDADAEAFFAKIGRPKQKSFWWPDSDGHKGSTVKAVWVADDSPES